MGCFGVHAAWAKVKWAKSPVSPHPPVLSQLQACRKEPELGARVTPGGLGLWLELGSIR